MTHTVHIIASCTDRKREEVPEALRLRAVTAPTIEERARTWWKRLQGAEVPTVQASNLYAGEHWRVVQGLPSVAQSSGYMPSLWVASAGYGLIPDTAPIRPYSATFSQGHEDSVVLNGQARDSSRLLRQWWTALAAHDGPVRSSVRSIQMLARSAPGASIIVVASPSYVRAMSEDLLAAAKSLQHPERLLVVSASSPLLRKELAPHWVPSTAHLQDRLGGSRLSLHARVARSILEKGDGRPLDSTRVREKYARLIRRSAPPRRYERQVMTDSEVQRFIRQMTTEGVNSWSAGLRLLRSRGFACEQSRFKKLFQDIKERP